MKRKVFIRYSSQKAEEPILASVIKESGLLVNILYANITGKGGEILISFDASEAEMDRILTLFREKGVEVWETERTIELDRELCFDCGACISVCPTKALRLNQDFSLELNEEKCICCEVCVSMCPVRALRISSKL